MWGCSKTYSGTEESVVRKFSLAKETMKVETRWGSPLTPSSRPKHHWWIVSQ